ncbi:hypothetical protein BESB_069450 [Besnoitia besnoiti]|uniref:Uncharacterized protein n=1 Tax=Besnoitia besnoiti TaxID=94643 RepID=A0A2A9MHN7_BESBE|nr:hypothetical protein BESB_069450 [Besnoitia besnoiti]PFH34912.1 hypothetical protein BESB_069450 [Besnoitia besnoiti]
MNPRSVSSGLGRGNPLPSREHLTRAASGHLDNKNVPHAELSSQQHTAYLPGATNSALQHSVDFRETRPLQGTPSRPAFPAFWEQNPCFLLTIEDDVSLRVTLSRNEDKWRGACEQDLVGCAMALYLLKGSNVEAAAIIEHTPFVSGKTGEFLLRISGNNHRFAVQEIIQQQT